MERFDADVKAHGGNPGAITDACIDISKFFITGLRKQFPNAVLTFDQFHVIKLKNDVLGKIRAEEARQFPEKLRKTCYLLQTNPNRLTQEQKKRLRSLPRFALESIKAYILKSGLQFAQDRQWAEILLQSWHRRAVCSKVERIVKLAKTVKKHWQSLLSYYDSRLTNGFLEGINSHVQAAKAKGRGYRNQENLIAMTDLIAGKLKFHQTGASLIGI